MPPASATLVARSRTVPWGFLVALGLALALGGAGVAALGSAIVPDQLGVFVEPPHWLFGVILIAFAVFLALVGVFELARYVRPAVEVVVDGDGVSIFGLLGRRRMRWGDIARVELRQGALTVEGAPRGSRPGTRLRIPASRLDVEPRTLLVTMASYRPDLPVRADWSLDLEP